MDDFIWLEPWAALDSSESRAVAFVSQLQRELAVGHPLYGVSVAVLGKNDCCDDVLFQLLDGTGRVAVVHLTWSQRTQEPPWPSAFLYTDLPTWGEVCMKPEAAEYQRQEDRP